MEYRDIGMCTEVEQIEVKSESGSPEDTSPEEDVPQRVRVSRTLRREGKLHCFLAKYLSGHTQTRRPISGPQCSQTFGSTGQQNCCCP